MTDRPAPSPSPEESLLQTFVAAAMDAIVATDAYGLIRVFNPAAAALFGRSAEDVIGQDVSLLVPERSRAAHAKLVRGFAHTHQTQRMMGKLGLIYGLHADGSELPLEASLSQLVVGGMELTAVVLRDVSDRVRAQAAIAGRLALEERLSKLAAVAPTVLYSFKLRPDGSMCMPYAAPSIESIWAVRPQDLVDDASEIFQRIVPDDLTRVRDSIAQSAETLTTWQAQFRVRHPTRGELWLEGCSTPTREPDGSTLWHGTVTDITARKRMELEWQRREHELATAQHLAKLNSWELDLPAGPAHWQDLPLRHTGYGWTVAATAPVHLLELVHADDRAELEHAVDVALANAGAFALDCRAAQPHAGLVTWLHLRGEVARDEYDVPRVVRGTTQDITERKQLETQLRQAQKMEAFGQLAGGVAHDFNNILTVISSSTDLLQSMLSSGDPRAEILADIEEASTRAIALTRQLLLFSRSQVIAPVPLSINEVVGNTFKMLRRLIGEDIHVRKQLDDSISRVLADPGQVEQVVMNLAVNARDAMPRGGTLTLSTRDIELSGSDVRNQPGRKAGKYVQLTVTDTGCGMTPEVRARIFEPFFTTKGAGRGTGLGLATVFGIVEQCGGQIMVESEPERGTTFQIYWPALQTAPQPLANVRTTTLPHGGTETILLVEDDDTARRSMRRALEQCGYVVIEAHDAPSAVEHAHSPRHIDLLLTDVVMPGGSGPSIAAALQLERPRLRTLYISGYVDDAVVRHGIVASRDSFLHKPFSISLLATRVREVLDAPSPRPE